MSPGIRKLTPTMGHLAKAANDVEIQVFPQRLAQGVGAEVVLQLKNRGPAPIHKIFVQWDHEANSVNELHPGQSWKWARIFKIEESTSTEVSAHWLRIDNEEYSLKQSFTLTVEPPVKRVSDLLDSLLGHEEPNV